LSLILKLFSVNIAVNLWLLMSFLSSNEQVVALRSTVAALETRIMELTDRGLSIQSSEEKHTVQDPLLLLAQGDQ
jgi:hypothetical protein